MGTSSTIRLVSNYAWRGPGTEKFPNSPFVATVGCLGDLTGGCERRKFPCMAFRHAGQILFLPEGFSAGGLNLL